MAREENAALARHISRVLPELNDQIGAGELVQSLLEHPGYRLVQGLVDAEISLINAEVERTTRPLEHTEYAQRHGRVGGLRGFELAAETLLARSEKRLQEQQAKHEGDAESSPER